MNERKLSSFTVPATAPAARPPDQAVQDELMHGGDGPPDLAALLAEDPGRHEDHVRMDDRARARIGLPDLKLPGGGALAEHPADEPELLVVEARLRGLHGRAAA